MAAEIEYVLCDSCGERINALDTEWRSTELDEDGRMHFAHYACLHPVDRAAGPTYRERSVARSERLTRERDAAKKAVV